LGAKIGFFLEETNENKGSDLVCHSEPRKAQSGEESNSKDSQIPRPKAPLFAGE